MPLGAWDPRPRALALGWRGRPPNFSLSQPEPLWQHADPCEPYQGLLSAHKLGLLVLGSWVHVQGGLVLGSSLPLPPPGQNFDMDSNMHDWWSKRSARHFWRQSECMVYP